MQARYYTLAEARSTLPEVKRLMGMVHAARREILRIRPEALPAIEKGAQNGGSKASGEIYRYGVQLEMGVREIMAMGVLVKDIDRGLVDFLGMRDGREIYLCWHYGEEDIAYWHELNGGFAGRHPIDEHIV